MPGFKELHSFCHFLDFSRSYFQQRSVLQAAAGSKAAGGTVGAMQGALPPGLGVQQEHQSPRHMASHSTGVKLVRIFRWKMEALVLLEINT